MTEARSDEGTDRASSTISGWATPSGRRPKFRRRIQTLIAVASLVLFLTASSMAAATSATWSESGYNPGHAGYNPLETTISLTNVHSLSVSFSVPTPTHVTSQILVADGKAVFASGSSLYAIDAISGASVWGGAPTCDGSDPGAPVIQSGIVWVGDPGGYVTGVSLASGAQIACRYLGGSVGKVVGANGVVFAQTLQGNVAALNATTGAVQWMKVGILPLAEYYGAQPALASGIVYAVAGHRFVALRASTGALVYSRKLGFPAYSQPVAAVGKVYIEDSVGDYLVALNATTGRVVWKFSEPGVMAFSVAGGVVYVANEDEAPGLYAVKATTGHMIWQSILSNEFFSQPTVANAVVYVNYEGELDAIDAKTGETVAAFSPSGGYYDEGIATAPTVVNGTVYETVRSGDYAGPGAVVALRP